MGYTDADRLIALETIERHDGSVDDAIDAVREMLGKKVSRATLFNWLSKKDSLKSVPVVQPVRQDKKIELVKLPPDWAAETLDNVFENVARAYLERAQDEKAIEKTNGKDAVMTAAIAVDKMRLLRNLPTEIVGVLPGLVESIRRAGYDPVAVFTRLQEKFDGQDYDQ